MKKFILSLACVSMLFSGCGTLSNLSKGSAIGAGSGAALGTAVGLLIGKDAKSAAIGAAIGTAIGAGTGAIIGDRMDKKAKDLEALQGANIEMIKDANGLDAIKVTFENGILFKTNSSTLSEASKTALGDFSKKMSDLPDTDITIYGHTDNTGTAAVNEKVSQQRADAVATYLQECGMNKTRITAEGKSFNMPVADNATAEGRAQNRRVEVYVTANADMIKAAEAGKLQ